MFKDEYKKQIDGICAEDSVKQQILKSLKGKKKAKHRKSNVLVFRAATAIAASFAVAFSVLIIKDSNKLPVAVGGEKKSYNDIYKTIEAFIPKNDMLGNFIEGIMNFGNKGADFAVDEEYEYVYENATDDMDAGTSGSTQKPSSSFTDSNNAKQDATEKSDGEYSETNTQVKGVDEADIIKTDGKYIYSFSSTNGEIRIIKAGKTPKLVKTLKVHHSKFSPMSDMYLAAGKLVIMGTRSDNRDSKTVAYIYDVSNPEKAEKAYECSQSGFYNTSRLIGDKLYLITNYNVNVDKVDKNDVETYVPCIESAGFDGAMVADDIYINKNCLRASYTVVCGYDINNGKLVGSQSLLGGTYTLYCNTSNIVTADYSYGKGASVKTNIARFAIDNGKVEFKAEGEIDGTLLNQFSIDEYGGYFRFVTTSSGGREVRRGDVVTYTFSQSNSLIVLDDELKKVSSIDNIAPDERVYSVRFMGDIAYFVTFRQVDPLFSVDLRDPKNPKIIGALKIPGFSNFLFPYGNGKLLGVGLDADEKTGRTSGIKLSMFDISMPSDVKESAKLILDAYDSPALYNHKESLIDVKRNIIGFSIWGKLGSEYRIFSFGNNAFNLKVKIKLDEAYSTLRGLYIGEEFYLVSEKTLLVYDANTYTEIARINLS